MNLNIGLEDPRGVSLDQQCVVQLFKSKSTLRLVTSLTAESFENFDKFILGELETKCETGIDEVVFKDKSHVLGIISFVGFFNGHVESLQLLAVLGNENLGTVGGLAKLDAPTLHKTIN
jgi:hypothetical protein